MAGVSLGASFSLNYIALKGKDGEKPLVEACFAISPCWEFSSTQIRLSAINSLDKHIVKEFREKMGHLEDLPEYQNFVKKVNLTQGIFNR